MEQRRRQIDFAQQIAKGAFGRDAQFLRLKRRVVMTGQRIEQAQLDHDEYVGPVMADDGDIGDDYG